MRDRKAACYEHGICDKDGEPGSGSSLFYINSWAMIWPTDHDVAHAWTGQWPFAVYDSVKTKCWKWVHSPFRCSLNQLLDMHIYTRILTHIHRYQQILTAKKTQGSLYALSGLLTWACVAISCPEMARTTKTSAVSMNLFRSISDHIVSKNILEYSHEHIVNIESYRKYLVNILWISLIFFPLGAGI